MTTTARHRPSRALNSEENDALFTLLGHGCEAKASGVVQVFVTNQPHHAAWFKRAVGVATFTKDNARRSFYIQVYDIMAMTRVLEQEIYKDFEYISSVPFFHQFEGEDRMIGLNFSNDEDALSFSNAVTEVLANRKRRKEERRRQMMAQQQQKLSEGLGQPQRQHQQDHQQQQQEHHQHHQQHQQHHDEPKHKDRRRFGKIGTRREKKKFRKSMIGDPFGFQHVSHAGFDNNNTFSSFNVDEDLEHLFSAVGLDKKTMADDNTRKFVYDFIENHGGFEEAKKASRKYSTRRVLDDHTSDGGPGGRAHGSHVGVRSHGSYAPAFRSSYSQAPVPPPPARDPPPPPSGMSVWEEDEEVAELFLPHTPVTYGYSSLVPEDYLV